MELIITLIVLIIVWCIAFMVGNKQGVNRTINQIKKDGGYFDMEITGAVYPYKHMPSWTPPTSSLNNDTMGTIGSKPKTQTDYQMEHKVEDETPAIDFMHNWIQEKSGKKPVSQKRKPKTTKEWEDEFDIGGNS
jgi:hypothetical protein